MQKIVNKYIDLFSKASLIQLCPIAFPLFLLPAEQPWLSTRQPNGSSPKLAPRCTVPVFYIRPSPSLELDRRAIERRASIALPLSYSPPSPARAREDPLPPQHLALVDSEDLIREILPRVGEDPDREGLRETPARIVCSWKELYGGYGQRSEDVLVTQFCAEQDDEMVLLRDIEFYSTCEHHMLPFYGKAHIAYLPNNKIVGLSKLARLLDMYARRLQVQERLTQQVATELQRVLRPKGVAVMIEGKHQCMCCRGVRNRKAKWSPPVCSVFSRRTSRREANFWRSQVKATDPWSHLRSFFATPEPVGRREAEPLVYSSPLSDFETTGWCWIVNTVLFDGSAKDLAKK